VLFPDLSFSSRFPLPPDVDLDLPHRFSCRAIDPAPLVSALPLNFLFATRRFLLRSKSSPPVRAVAMLGS
jgi:hypothetical protein